MSATEKTSRGAVEHLLKRSGLSLPPAHQELAAMTWTPPWLTGQVARVCRTSGSDRHLAATSAGVR